MTITFAYTFIGFLFSIFSYIKDESKMTYIYIMHGPQRWSIILFLGFFMCTFFWPMLFLKLLKDFVNKEK